MRRGRKPLGIEQVDRVPGSPAAKERLRVILANIAGELSIEDACGTLGIEPSRLFDPGSGQLPGGMGRDAGTENTGP